MVSRAIGEELHHCLKTGIHMHKDGREVILNNKTGAEGMKIYSMRIYI